MQNSWLRWHRRLICATALLQLLLPPVGIRKAAAADLNLLPHLAFQGGGQSLKMLGAEGSFSIPIWQFAILVAVAADFYTLDYNDQTSEDIHEENYLAGVSYSPVPSRWLSLRILVGQQHRLGSSGAADLTQFRVGAGVGALLPLGKHLFMNVGSDVFQLLTEKQRRVEAHAGLTLRL